MANLHHRVILSVQESEYPKGDDVHGCILHIVSYNIRFFIIDFRKLATSFVLASHLERFLTYPPSTIRQ